MEAKLSNLEAEETNSFMRWRDTKKVKFSPSGVKPSFVMASLRARLKAFTVDSFMILMPLLYIIFYVVFGSRDAFRAHMLEGWLLVLIPHFAITTLFLFYKAQTPGYKAYDILLVSTKTLKNANLGQLFLRYILFLLTAISFLGLFLPFFRKDKLSLYDILSRTMSINNPKSTLS